MLALPAGFRISAATAWLDDPGMPVVGKLDWDRLRPTRLTPNEQYTRISLWCLLSGPLLIGCDMS
jgi:alpha-galactosidase